MVDYVEKCSKCGNRNITKGYFGPCVDNPLTHELKNEHYQDFLCDETNGGCGFEWVAIFKVAGWIAYDLPEKCLPRNCTAIPKGKNCTHYVKGKCV